MWLLPARYVFAHSERHAHHQTGANLMTGLVVSTLHVVAMTDTCTVVAHLVTDEAVAAGRHAGRYVGACGAVVLPGSLMEATSRYCRSCQDRTAQ